MSLAAGDTVHWTEAAELGAAPKTRHALVVSDEAGGNVVLALTDVGTVRVMIFMASASVTKDT